jgi:hypothetical protein
MVSGCAQVGVMIAAADSASAPRCAHQRNAFKGVIIWPWLARSLVGELVFMILNGEITQSGFATMGYIYKEMHDIEATCVVQGSDFAHRSAPIEKKKTARGAALSIVLSLLCAINLLRGRMHLLCASNASFFERWCLCGVA